MNSVEGHIYIEKDKIVGHFNHSEMFSTGSYGEFKQAQVLNKVAQDC